MITIKIGVKVKKKARLQCHHQVLHQWNIFFFFKFGIFYIKVQILKLTITRVRVEIKTMQYSVINRDYFGCNLFVLLFFFFTIPLRHREAVYFSYLKSFTTPKTEWGEGGLL